MWGQFSPHIILVLISNIFFASCIEKGSLTFVIDDTLSMGDDIRQVKENANEITKIVFEEKASHIQNMVLVTFNDPYAELRTVTTDRDEFKRKINEVYVRNPYDNRWCEEPSMNGILMGLEQSLPGSFIYVFTDASASDYKKSDMVKTLCQKKQSQIVFVLTGECYGVHSLDFKVYYEIATACSGLVFFVKKNEVNKVLIPLRDMLGGNAVLKTLLTPANKDTDVPFVIDDQTDYALVTASGTHVSLRIEGPSAEKENVLWVDNAKSIKLKNPTPGTYTAKVNGHTATSVYISGKTDFTFSHGFSKLMPKNINDTTKQPIADAQTHLSISVTDERHVVDIKLAQILDMKENVLKTLSLKQIGKDFYTTPTFVAPSERFKVAVIGRAVRNGQEIKRIAKIPITPQEPPIVLPDPKTPVITISEGSKTEVEYDKTAKLTCKVSAYPAPKIIWKNSRGVLLSSQSDVVEPPYEYISYVTIPNVTERDSYTCYAVSAGTTPQDKTIDVVVKEPFDIRSVPQGTTQLHYGKSGTIKCDIRSSVSIHIKWYFHHLDTQNAAEDERNSIVSDNKHTISRDGTRLDINRMDLDLSGTYACKAYVDKNPRKFVIFNTRVKISDLARPVITGISDQKVIKGSDTSLTCHVTGVPNPSISWQFKAPKEYAFIPISSGHNTLFLTKVDVKNSGIYKCIAQNSLGTASHVTALSVQVPPKITTSPLTVYNAVEEKDAVLRLPCASIGDPKPVITWTLNGVAIVPNNKYSLEDGTLVIKDPKVGDSNEYKCKAKNDAGAVVETYHVEILQAPKLSGETTKTVKTGDAVEIKCIVQKGVPIPKITWQYMGKGDTIYKSMSTPGDVLRIPRVNKNYDGIYKCVAENSVASDEHITTLNVEFAPIITKPSKLYRGLEGDVALKIPCDVIGLPQPAITWKLDATVITPDARYSIVDGALIIKDPNVNDSKSYTCEAKNYLGSDKAKFVAEINSNLEDYGIVNEFDVLDGTSMKLNCLVAAPNQRVRWFKEGVELDEKTKYLNINNINILKEGNYTCHVSDMNGGKTYTYELLVGYWPKFSSDQEDTTFDWNGSENDVLDCSVNAKPKPNIVWTFNGQVLSDKKSPTLAIDYKWGQYTCNVSNIHGAVQKTFDVISSACLIPRTPKDGSITTMPLMLTEESTWPVLDSTRNYLKVNSGETIVFSCPSGRNRPNQLQTLDTANKITAVCDKQNIFNVNGKPYQVADFKCTHEVNSVIKKEGKCSTDSSKLIRVGYDVHGFLEAYNLCYDTAKNIPQYSRVLMSKSNRGIGVKYDWNVYTDIGDGKEESRYTCAHANSSCCYAKKQLVNSDDVLVGPAQRSTFIDSLNAVPYWRPCDTNKDPWNIIENGIRSQLYNNDQFVVFSGTYMLQEKNGQVIPRYLWKVVRFDEEDSIAIVYVNDETFSKADILCENVCADVNNVQWSNGENIKNTYCCEVDAFLQVTGIPKLE